MGKIANGAVYIDGHQQTDDATDTWSNNRQSAEHNQDTAGTSQVPYRTTTAT
jgi:hypothetical protein